MRNDFIASLTEKLAKSLLIFSFLFNSLEKSKRKNDFFFFVSTNLDAEKHKLILEIFEKAGFELALHINAITIRLDQV